MFDLVGSEEDADFIELEPSGEVCSDFSQKKEKERKRRKEPDVKVV